MDMDPLILIANPGSASRKYALYQGTEPRADMHFEFEDGKIVCTIKTADQKFTETTELKELVESSSVIVSLLHENNILSPDETISSVGLRFVAPGSYFTEDHIIDDEFVARMEQTLPHAPLHIAATLAELQELRRQFADTTIVGVSDSAFHRNKPAYAEHYGLPLEDANRLEIKRYGYHGLSYMSVVKTLSDAGRLPQKTIVAHLGSGASISAILDGKSVDTSMGYSPLEGLIMSTRSGTIDAAITNVLRKELQLDDSGIETYLNKKSGLLGLGGSDDIRELLTREAAGDERATLALDTYAYTAQKVIANMAVAMDGVDTLVFTGTVGQRSAPMRERILSRLHHLGLEIDTEKSENCDASQPIVAIEADGSKPILVVATDEQFSLVTHVLEALA